jgi:hypothetical protein
VSGHGLLFRDGSVEIRVECTSAVAPGSGDYRVYVVHEADCRAGRVPEPLRFGSTDKAEWVLGKH